MSTNPVMGFLRYHCLMLSGRVHYPNFSQIKDKFPLLTQLDDSHFEPILSVECSHAGIPSGANLIVKFRVSGPKLFHRYLLPYACIPMFAGMPGFQAKVFFYRESDNSYKGVYQWESKEAVENYVNAYPGKFMRRLAVPGSLEITFLENL